MRIKSPVFEHEGKIPARYTCDGENINPPLVFEDAPEGTQTFALIVEDPDVPKEIRPDGMWDHWVVWNIPHDEPEIRENAMFETGGFVGKNTRGKNEYGGPCPPDREHRYFFKLYALDDLLDLDPDVATKEDVLRAMEGHVLAQAELMGRYDRRAA